jgi:hypothetical protein
MKNLFAIIGGLVALAVCGCVGLLVLGGGLAAVSPSQSRVQVSGTPSTAAPAATAQTAAQPVGKVGQVVAGGGLELTVAAVEAVTRLPFGTIKPGHHYIAAQVSIRNADRDEAPYNPLYFKLRDSGGFEYSGSLLNAKEPGLKSGKLAKGETVAGWVSFEVPVEAAGLVVTMEPLVIGGGYRALRVDLGR